MTIVWLVFQFGRQRLKKEFPRSGEDQNDDDDEEEEQVTNDVICRDKLVLRPTIEKVQYNNTLCFEGCLYIVRLWFSWKISEN